MEGLPAGWGAGAWGKAASKAAWKATVATTAKMGEIEMVGRTETLVRVGSRVLVAEALGSAAMKAASRVVVVVRAALAASVVIEGGKSLGRGRHCQSWLLDLA